MDQAVQFVQWDQLVQSLRLHLQYQQAQMVQEDLKVHVVQQVQLLQFLHVHQQVLLVLGVHLVQLALRVLMGQAVLKVQKVQMDLQGHVLQLFQVVQMVLKKQYSDIKLFVTGYI